MIFELTIEEENIWNRFQMKCTSYQKQFVQTRSISRRRWCTESLWTPETWRGEFPLCSKTPNHLVFQPPSIQVVGEISAQNSQTCWNRTSLVLNETGMLDRRRKGHGETNYMEVCQMSEDKKPNYQQSRWQISLKTESPCLLPLSTTQELTTLDKSL